MENGSEKGTVQDILTNLIELMPILGWLIVVVSAISGLCLCGYALQKLYDDNTSGQASLRWLGAFSVGCMMTVIPVFIALFSYAYT